MPKWVVPAGEGAATLASDLARLRDTAAALADQATRIEASAAGEVEDDEGQGET